MSIVVDHLLPGAVLLCTESFAGTGIFTMPHGPGGVRCVRVGRVPRRDPG